MAYFDPDHKEHEIGHCPCEVTPGVYKFYPKKADGGWTSYGLTTSVCPFECNEQWLKDCEKFSEISDFISPESSLSRVVLIRFFNKIASKQFYH